MYSHRIFAVSLGFALFASPAIWGQTATDPAPGAAPSSPESSEANKAEAPRPAPAAPKSKTKTPAPKPAAKPSPGAKPKAAPKAAPAGTSNTAKPKAAAKPAAKPAAGGVPTSAKPTGPVADPANAPTGLIIERIVAVVDNDVVLLSEVQTALDAIRQAEPPPAGADKALYYKRRKKEVMETLIADKLLEQQIRKLRIDVSDEEVSRAMDATKAQYKLDDAGLEMALAQQGITPSEYRENLKKQLLKLKIVELKVKSRVQVTDQDVKSSVATKKAAAQEAYALRASHILFLVGDDNEAAKKALADEALARVNNGESFADVARAVSEGPSRENGGALGTFGRGEMLPAFEEAAFVAEVGVPVGPVRTQVGWHVILVEERVVQDVPEGDDKTEALRAELYEQEMERAFRRYIDELKADAFIEIREDALAAK